MTPVSFSNTVLVTLMFVWPCILNLKRFGGPSWCNNYDLLINQWLNMFRAPLCPSSGAQGWLSSADFKCWKPHAVVYSPALLKMGTKVPETCWIIDLSINRNCCIKLVQQIISLYSYFRLLWPISFSPTTREFYFVLCFAFGIFEKLHVPSFLFFLSPVLALELGFWARKALLPPNCLCVSCPWLQLRFLKALLIFVTHKLSFLFLLFIVVDFLLECGEKLTGEKYPFERIL